MFSDSRVTYFVYFSSNCWLKGSESISNSPVIDGLLEVGLLFV